MISNIKRRIYLKLLIQKVNLNETITIRQLKQALTADEYIGYRQEKTYTAKEILSHSEYKYLKQYLARLREADRLYEYAGKRKNRWFRKTLKRVLKKSFYKKAELEYERAYESLNQLIQICPQVTLLFDRPVCYGIDHHFEPEPEAAPRLSSQYSDYVLKDKYAMKEESNMLKLKYLEESLQKIDHPELFDNAKIRAKKLKDDLYREQNPWADIF